MAGSANVDYYDYAVVGCGGMGCGTMYWLTKKAPSAKIIGLEQFRLGHDHGGSQDISRMIRYMYASENYAKLTPHAYKLWQEIEDESGVQLVHKTGALDITREGCQMGRTVLKDYAAAMKSGSVPHEFLNATEIRRRFPQFTLPDDAIALYQNDGGVINPALATAVHAQLARGRGATILENCLVKRLQRDGSDSILIHTSRGLFRARRVIITAGAWTNQVIGSLGVHIPLVISQEQVTYLATPHIKDFTKDKLPLHVYYTDECNYYGLPIHGNSGYKIGIDLGGQPVTPETRGYEADQKREKLSLEFLEKHMPKAVGPILYTKTCLYTMPLDRDFIIDNLRHVNLPEVFICLDGGHAFKFSSLLGKIMSELATDGKTQYEISAFNIARPAVTDPNFKPTFRLVFADAKNSSKL